MNNTECIYSYPRVQYSICKVADKSNFLFFKCVTLYVILSMDSSLYWLSIKTFLISSTIKLLHLNVRLDHPVYIYTRCYLIVGTYFNL